MKKAILLLIITFGLITSLSIFASEKRKINDVYSIIFIMDGLNYETFTRGINEGAAPNIKKHFIDKGAYFTDATTIFPSISSSAYLSYVSGLFPGHSGLTYLGWFDRPREEPINYFSLSGHKHLDLDLINLRTLLDPDIGELYPPSTMFDFLRGHKTAAIYASFNDNATIRRPKIPIPAFWSTFGSGREEMLNKYAFKEVLEIYNAPSSEIPRFTLVGLYGFDAHGHHHGSKSQIVIYTLEHFDNFLNNFFELLKKRGIYDKTYVIIAADHGMHDTPKGKFNLKKFIDKTGLKKYAGRPKRENYDVYVASRGIGAANLYLKGENGWLDRPSYERLRNYPLQNGKTLDVVQTIVDAPELKFAIVRDGFYKSHVISYEGHGVISYQTNGRSEKYSYRVLEGRDPLEMDKSRAAKMVGKGFYSANIWGQKTSDHKYPDAIIQLAQVFADGRSGDVYIVADPGYVFFREKSGTHGSFYREDMHVPFLVRGPTIPKGKYGFARTADLFPTMLDWFGIKDGGWHDGKHLFRSKIQDPRSKTDPRSKIPKIRRKLERVRSDLMLQKGDPKGYQFTSGLVLDANLWLVDEQLKRLNNNAKTILQ